MYWSIVRYKYLQDYKLHLTFKNGKSGVVDFRGYIRDRGLFRKFKEIDYFRRVTLNEELGVLQWPGGLDIAPETLYYQATGEPLPEWMVREGPGGRREKRRKAV